MSCAIQAESTPGSKRDIKPKANKHKKNNESQPLFDDEWGLLCFVFRMNRGEEECIEKTNRERNTIRKNNGKAIYKLIIIRYS